MSDNYRSRQCIGLDFTANNRHQSVGTSIINNLRIDFPASLQNAENRDFSGGALSPLPFPNSPPSNFHPIQSLRLPSEASASSFSAMMP